MRSLTTWLNVILAAWLWITAVFAVDAARTTIAFQESVQSGTQPSLATGLSVTAYLVAGLGAVLIAFGVLVWGRRRSWEVKATLTLVLLTVHELVGGFGSFVLTMFAVRWNG